MQQPTGMPFQPQQQQQQQQQRPTYDKKSVQTIYPQYIDATLTPSEGRRLTRTQSVENPQLNEIIQALGKLGYKQCHVEATKSLPCSQASEKFAMVPRGCIKVAIKTPVDAHYIKKSDFDTQSRGSVVDGINSKQELLRRIAALIKETNVERPKVSDVAAVMTAITPGPKKK